MCSVHQLIPATSRLNGPMDHSRRSTTEYRPIAPAGGGHQLSRSVEDVVERSRRHPVFHRWRVQAHDCPNTTSLHHFASWHQMRRLREHARKQQLGDSQTRRAKEEITQAGAFLIHLASEERHVRECRQSDLDAWHTHHTATRRPAQTFIRWCMKSGRMPRLTLPPQTRYPQPPQLSEHDRLTMLRKILNDPAPPLHSRTAPARPPLRPARHTPHPPHPRRRHHQRRHHHHPSRRTPSPLPRPVADLIHTYINTLKPPGSNHTRWLFPGRQPGQPINPVSLQTQLRKLGVPPRLVRSRHPPAHLQAPRTSPRKSTRLPRPDHLTTRHRNRHHMEPIRPQ